MDRFFDLHGDVQMLHESTHLRKASSRGYRYKKLKDPTTEIRILRLLPSNEHDEIRCSLETHSLDDRPFYMAVSYEWKSHDPEAGVEIFIDNKVTRISHNLWLFLEYLQQHKRSDVKSNHFRLWVDALCIHQDDLSEKMAQVSLMGRIFEQADHVFAWLGPAAKVNASVTFKFVRAFAANMNYKEHVCRSYFESLLSQEDGDAQFDSHDLTDVWASLYELCQLSYWYRRWIVQEVLFARNFSLLCNSEECMWADWQKVFEYINSWLSHSSFRWAHTDGYRIRNGIFLQLKSTTPWKIHLYRQKSKQPEYQPPSLRTLVHDFDTTECHLAHDHVYALLNLARERGQLNADYDCSPTELFAHLLQVVPLERSILGQEPPTSWPAQLARLLKLSVSISGTGSSSTLKSIPLSLNQAGVSCIEMDCSNVTEDNLENLWASAQSSYEIMKEYGALQNIRHLSSTGPYNATLLNQLQNTWPTRLVSAKLAGPSSLNERVQIDPVPPVLLHASPKLFSLENGLKVYGIGYCERGDLVFWCGASRFGLVVRPLQGNNSLWLTGIAGLGDDHDHREVANSDHHGYPAEEIRFDLSLPVWLALRRLCLGETS